MIDIIIILLIISIIIVFLKIISSNAHGCNIHDEMRDEIQNKMKINDDFINDICRDCFNFANNKPKLLDRVPEFKQQTGVKEVLTKKSI